jgi:hypothetical protein
MVCATIDSRAEKTTRSTIAGGFILVPDSSLMAAWRACRSRPLGIGDFRTWLAAHEMQARRCVLDEGRPATYTLDELAVLIGVTRKRAGASLRRLEAAGLIAWSDERIAFPAQPDPVGGGTHEILETLSRGRGSLAIPRRMLRLLANGARPALIATALGILLRCLSRRQGGFDGRGRIKAAWIAQVFGIDLRGVKRARRELVALGWVSTEPSEARTSDAWATRRWGPAYRIDLAWTAHQTTGPRLPPIPAISGPAIATPRSDREPLRERNQNQEPGPAGPAGVQSSGFNKQSQTPPEAGPLPTPRLDDVRVEDLRDTGRLLELHGQAVARGVVTASEADRLHVAAAAEHALSIGKANTPGLFAHLVRGRLWRYLTQADEDRANARIKAHDRGPEPFRGLGGMVALLTPSPGHPSDAEIVRAVRSATIKAGVFRDPFPAFQRLNPSWSRERWDRAMEGRQS